MKRIILLCLMEPFWLSVKADNFSFSDLSCEEKKVSEILLAEQIYWGTDNQYLCGLAKNFTNVNQTVQMEIKRIIYDDSSSLLTFNQVNPKGQPQPFLSFSFFSDASGHFIGNSFFRQCSKMTFRNEKKWYIDIEMPMNYRWVVLSEWERVKTNQTIMAELRVAVLGGEDVQGYPKEKKVSHKVINNDAVGIVWIGPFTQYSSFIHLFRPQKQNGCFMGMIPAKRPFSIDGFSPIYPKIILGYAISLNTVRDIAEPVNTDYLVAKQMQNVKMKTSSPETLSLLDS